MKSSPTANFEQRTKLSWAIFYIPNVSASYLLDYQLLKLKYNEEN